MLARRLHTCILIDRIPEPLNFHTRLCKIACFRSIVTMITPRINRQLAVSTLFGLGFALSLHAAIIARVSILLFVPLLPGIIGAVLTGHLPPCGPQQTDGSDDPFLYCTMWCNSVFYSAAAFAGLRLWMHRKTKRLRNVNSASILYSNPPEIPFNKIGSLLQYGRSSRLNAIDIKTTDDRVT